MELRHYHLAEAFLTSVWTEGYATEIDYTHGYYRELAPAMQVIRCRADDAPYLELGYGQGMSAIIHAASTPCPVWGTDFDAVMAPRPAANDRSAELNSSSTPSYGAPPRSWISWLPTDSAASRRARWIGSAWSGRAASPVESTVWARSRRGVGRAS
jgi:hypothetical protein